jgi:hypothetical protein
MLRGPPGGGNRRAGLGRDDRKSRRTKDILVGQALGMETCSWPTRHCPLVFCRQVVTRTQ